ncbi:uncharacterized protein LOC115695372 [Cannabis sativa]|uniref:uncharacterized protein LOC115695372 n=1 Tax=Cannabis sativa TaxID=3483 RepID=UPI0011DF0A8C|nr:uncharacterized protein LOC115695372 [Cannabis sativa]
MSIISWNARGLGSKRAFRSLSLLVKQNRPTLLYIMESKLPVGALNKFASSLKFPNGLEVPRVGLSGGLLLLWTHVVDVTLLSYNISHFHCYLKFPNFHAFTFTAFYGAPHTQNKLHTWQLIDRLGSTARLQPWLIMGDFNDYLSLSDKIGGNMSRAPSAQFQSFIDNHELHPLTPLGNLFTWTNRQKQPNHTQERLDWCLSNNAWDAIFPDSQLNHGDFFGSDHRPLILTLQYMNGHRNQKPRFIFDKLWMSEPGFEDCLRDAWTQTNPNPHPNPLIGLKERLTTCSSRLTLWKQSLGPPIATQIRITERLTLAEIALLQATFTAIEIKTATFQLAHEKAPGLDGFNDSFFQKNWHLLGQDVTAAALNFLNGDADLSTVNQTLIVLIPKRPNPEQITDYRPISLCSTFYKIISRVLVNRLKPILSRIISPSQSAFLPSRLISDNIIIGQEVMHSLTHRKSGKLGWMALKLDMAKAFDRVEWVFIRKIMEHFLFPKRFIDLIMACVSTATFSFSLNQQVLGTIKPTRGIRQGDPLSPYLFLLCYEGLSSLINYKTQQRQPRSHSLSIKIARRAPTISHLFFADDSLLFSSS